MCLDNVELLSGGQPPAYEPETGPRVRVNQYGYEPDGPKRATLVTETTDPVAWRLVDAAGATAAEGMSVPFGGDPSSRLVVQVIDFSEVTAEGTYTLAADDDESYPFAIATDLYGQLRYDALGYFYLARSGIEIDAAIVGDDYARAAGHVSTAGGSDTNQGDYAVGCQPAGDSEPIYGEPWTCDYTLDVVGGWYDAGDHGKYVVNGGIATSQLLSAYERTLRADGDARDALGDSVLALPETDNGIPDVLDEAKWELDFMVSMMVPEGEQYAGMVHHKIHDFGWTSLPLMPADDDYAALPAPPLDRRDAQPRRDGRPGRAALQEVRRRRTRTRSSRPPRPRGTRPWRRPDLYAPAEDGTAGGGAYSDTHVNDEFYWAAAELYLTTGDSEYEEYLLASSLHRVNVFSEAGFDWGHTAALGRLDLATVESDIPERDKLVASVVKGADAILAVQAEQGFGQALGAEDFVWGSNALVLNNQVVLATAYDLTGEPAYLAAVRESMDYLLGRNGLNQSYVTGYGTVLRAEPALPLVRRADGPGVPAPAGRNRSGRAERRGGVVGSGDRGALPRRATARPRCATWTTSSRIRRTRSP